MSRDMTKPTKWVCAQRRLGSAWASAQSDQSSLSAWRKLGSLATHWVPHEDSDQTGQTWISLGIRPVWSVFTVRLKKAWIHWVPHEDSDQTGRMPRLIWVFAGRTVIFLVLSCCGWNGDFLHKLGGIIAWKVNKSYVVKSLKFKKD